MAVTAAPPLVLMLSPSDLTFLLHECERCFYNKVRLGRRLPRTPMPSVFTEMDRQQRAFFHGKSTAALNAGLPHGVLNCHPAGVASGTYLLEGCPVGVRFRGAIDAGIAFESGGFGIVDFKTTNPLSTEVDMYRHQLHAYAFCVEHPAPGVAPVGPVERLGLLCFYPTGMTVLKDGAYAFRANPTWLEVPRDDKLFASLMRHVLTLLGRPEAPLAGTSCPRCSG